MSLKNLLKLKEEHLLITTQQILDRSIKPSRKIPSCPKIFQNAKVADKVYWYGVSEGEQDTNAEIIHIEAGKIVARHFSGIVGKFNIEGRLIKGACVGYSAILLFWSRPIIIAPPQPPRQKSKACVKGWVNFNPKAESFQNYLFKEESEAKEQCAEGSITISFNQEYEVDE